MGRAIGTRKPIVRRFRYDFAKQGGAVSAIALVDQEHDDSKLPDNANIVRAWIEPVVDLTSGGSATVKLGITGNDDAFIAATAFNNTAFDAPDKITPLTAEVPLKVNAAGGVQVLATIATAALTAGSFDIHVEYLPGS